MSSSGWIGVDLDGTLAHYESWQGPAHVGAPVPAMVERVKRWIEQGNRVKIFTARISARDEDERRVVRLAIEDWLEKNGLPRLEVTCVKDYAMIELWDDRCVQVIPNTGEPVGQSTRGLA